MKKYSAHACTCGVIHLLPVEIINWLKEDYKHRFIIEVCQNCGFTTKTTFEKTGDYFCSYTTIVDEGELSQEDLKNGKILFNKGIRVPMTNGNYATKCLSGTFMNKGSFDVNVKRLIKEIKDRDKLESIAANEFIDINWKNTKFERK